MNNLLKQLTSEIEKNREDLSPVKRAWLSSCQRIGLIEDNHFVQFGLKFSNHPDLVNSENPYHNHIHSADAIISASFLAKEEFEGQSLKNNGAMLLFSMMLHDIQHNGGHNEFDYQLEKAAVSSIHSYMDSNPELREYWQDNLEKEYGTWNSFVKKVESVILGTDFKNGPTVNLKNYEKNPLDLNKIKLLANEADILASCTSDLGPKLGLALSQEQNNPGIASWKGREFFMEKLAKFGSVASEKIGIKKHISEQLDVIRSFGATKLDEESVNGNFFNVAQKIHDMANVPLVELRDKYLEDNKNNNNKHKM
jgi:hypothetical protein